MAAAAAVAVAAVAAVLMSSSQSVHLVTGASGDWRGDDGDDVSSHQRFPFLDHLKSGGGGGSGGADVGNQGQHTLGGGVNDEPYARLREPDPAVYAEPDDVEAANAVWENACAEEAKGEEEGEGDVIPESCDGRNARQCRAAVTNAIAHAWHGYEQHAWGHDDLTPDGPNGQPAGVDWLRFGLTIVDSLDTLLLANLTDEFERAREWVRTCLHFDLEYGVCQASPRETSEGHPMSGARRKPICTCASQRRGGGGGDGGGSGQRSVNVFETTIRVIGGLLGAHTLVNNRGDVADSIFVDKAREFARGLEPAFMTRSGIPMSDINPATGEAAGPGWIDASSVAEAGSILLEFVTAGRLSEDNMLSELVDNAMKKIMDLSTIWTDGCPGLVPTFLKVDEDDAPLNAAFASDRGRRSTASRPSSVGDFASSFGGRSDSYYETLLKGYLLSNKTRLDMLHMYRMAVNCARSVLVRRTSGGLWAIGKCAFKGGANHRAESGSSSPPSCTYTPQMDHLACFLPGTLALGWMNGADGRSGDLNATLKYNHESRDADHDGGMNTEGFPDELDDLALARELMRTCWESYARTPMGMGPEIVHFQVASARQRRDYRRVSAGAGVGGGMAASYLRSLWARDSTGADEWYASPGSEGAERSRKAGRRRAARSRRTQPRLREIQLGLGLHVKLTDAHHILRPEMVESLYYLWLATGDPMYREWGRQYLVTLNWCCRLRDGGFGGLDSVLSADADWEEEDSMGHVPEEHARKKMESFFLAESLKYLLLLFSDADRGDPVPNVFEYIYNTEAHPMKVLD